MDSWLLWKLKNVNPAEDVLKNEHKIKHSNAKKRLKLSFNHCKIIWNSKQFCLLGVFFNPNVALSKTGSHKNRFDFFMRHCLKETFPAPLFGQILFYLQLPLNFCFSLQFIPLFRRLFFFSKPVIYDVFQTENNQNLISHRVFFSASSTSKT